MAQPTTKQKITFGNLLKKIEKKQPYDLKTLMIDAGYSITTAKNPTANLLKKNGWNQLLAQIDDSVILAKFYEILLSDDKRSSLAAGIELTKLKDHYPASKTKITAYKEETEGLID